MAALRSICPLSLVDFRYRLVTQTLRARFNQMTELMMSETWAKDSFHLRVSAP